MVINGYPMNYLALSKNGGSPKTVVISLLTIAMNLDG